MPQHTEGMVGSLNMGFVGNLVLFPAVKEFLKNPLRIDEVIAISLVYCFFWT